MHRGILNIFLIREAKRKQIAQEAQRRCVDYLNIKREFL